MHAKTFSRILPFLKFELFVQILFTYKKCRKLGLHNFSNNRPNFKQRAVIKSAQILKIIRLTEFFLGLQFSLKTLIENGLTVDFVR